MEKEIKLVPKKDKFILNKLFKDKKKRYLLTFLLIVPFLIGIGIFSFVIYREAMNLINLAKGPSETKPSNIITINDQNAYILRDNATDLQKEYFAQLKEAMESAEATSEDKAQLVAKNYVADFYTWTNKQGQYDVGGMYYIYDGEFEDGDHFKENVYDAARYGYYKYMGYYANQYGSENLLEVDNVEVTNCSKMSEQFRINEHVANKQDANGDWYDYREDHYYDAYKVSCKWTYKPETALIESQFANSINLLIIDNGGKFVIVEASESEVHGRTKKEDSKSDEQSEEETEDSESTENS